MTREEAGKLLNKWGVLLPSEAQDAVDMAIEALQREEAEEKGYCHRIMPKEYSSADAVSREDYHNLLMASKDIDRALREYQAKEENGELVSVVRKPIKGYEDYYEVDQFGRVFAKDRTIHVTDHDREYDKHLPSRQMKQSVHTKGYKTVTLTKDGKCTTAFVHRLVAEAFIPNTDDLPFVNHIDEDKTNNFVENLEWCTEQYNSTYGKAREKHAKALKGRHHSEEHKRKISDSLKRFYGER